MLYAKLLKQFTNQKQKPKKNKPINYTSTKYLKY